MRRVAGIVVVVAALAAVVWAVVSVGDGDDGYLVRGYFDNAGFLVEGEEVRIAGARVGSVEDVEVSRPGEVVSEDGAEDPGKAVVVMRIDDAGFQNWLIDASCLIRPQSLLGEKYVDCSPTQPRAPGSPPPPPLEVIPDGEIGAGEHMLPLENNGKQVDLDLINNITREPEVDRFRLILNDLGAGLAARGDVLEEVIRRANPALQETDELLLQLARQNRELAQLAADSDAILTPLSRERARLAGFIRNATIAGEASAERRDDIVLGLQRFPPALEELESTMVELQRFARAGQPVAQNLLVAAPALTEATRALKPFSKAGTGALVSLGDAAAESGENLAAAAPVIRDLKTLAEASTPGAKNLKRFLATFRKTDGIEYLMDFIFNTGNVFNGFDDFGHYLRAQVQITNCVSYDVRPVFGSGCEATWGAADGLSAPLPSAAETLRDSAPQSQGSDLDGDGSVEGAGAGEGTDDKTPEAGRSDEEATANGDLFKFLMGAGR